MLTITKREQIGTIRGKTIYRVGAFQIFPLAENLSGLNENQVRHKFEEEKRSSLKFYREWKNKHLLIFLKVILKTIRFITLMILI